ncbi:ATP-binding cassette domain-containing protein, partial [Rhizobium ruizarguesonis]
GSGKSTPIKVISGVYRPAGGAEIVFDGETISNMTPGMAQSRGIQIIWQDLALFPEMSVAENIAFQTLSCSRPRFVNYAAIRGIAEDALARLGVILD